MNKLETMRNRIDTIESEIQDTEERLKITTVDMGAGKQSYEEQV